MRKVLGIVILLAASAAVYIYVGHGLYGFNAVRLRGAALWEEIKADDPRLSRAARLGLGGANAAPGSVDWSEPAPGFEVAEMPILVEGREEDRLLLARIDPARWRFTVRNQPAGSKRVDAWLAELGAALVVNGSYYGLKGEADTPFLSEGRALGPVEYAARHGAFVQSVAGAHVVDLKDKNWRDIFAGADNAFVSYPMLIGDAGDNRAAPSQWLAARSFIGEEASGRIIIGTTKDALLSLPAFGNLLRAAPLALVRALNLDGGPVACQWIAAGVYRRRQCGAMEVQSEPGTVKLLRPILPGFDWSRPEDSWPLPVVIAVTPR